MKKNALFFVGINCCVLGSLTIYFSIEVKESLKKRSCLFFSFFFFKTIPDYDWAFFSSNKPIFGGLILLGKNRFSL
jgi:hypothetical protein